MNPSGVLTPASAFGSYTIEGFLAAGGMGQVYAARHSVYGTVVALKVLHAELHKDKEWRRRFDIEGLVGTQLKHPHVLAARELVEHDGRVALVLDLVFGGQTLLKVVTREFATGIPVVGALQVFLGILQGVEYAHTKGIVHGDIKPENVLLTGDSRDPSSWKTLVSDFGTVALISHPVRIDGQVAVVASPRYASPEHMYGVDHLEKRSDLYALGLMLHFLLTGRHVSDARNVEEAAVRVMKPIPLTLLVDQPESVISLVRKACSLQLEDRFATCREFALAVRRVLDDRGVKLALEDLHTELATEVMEERAKMKPGPQQDTPGVSSEPTDPMKDPEPTKNPLWGNKIDLTDDDDDAPTARLTPDRSGGKRWQGADTPAPAPTDRLKPGDKGLGGDVATDPPAAERRATPAPAPAPVKKTKSSDIVTIPEFPAPAPSSVLRPSQLDTAPSMETPDLKDLPPSQVSTTPRPPPRPPSMPPPPPPAGSEIPLVAYAAGGAALLLIVVVLAYLYAG